MRIVQPAVAKRITFSTWARKAGHRRHSSVSYYIPDEVDIPQSLLAGAQIDGKPYQAEPPKPKRTRRPKVEVIEAPEPEPEQDPLEQTGEQQVFNPDDEPTEEED